MYELKYSVTDLDGNTTTVIRKVTVKAKSEERPEVSEEKPEEKTEVPEEKPEVTEEKPEVPEEKPEVPEEKPEVPGETPNEKPQVVLPEGTTGNTNFSDKLPQNGVNYSVIAVLMGMIMTIGGAFIYSVKKK